jgi:uncharacterized protein
MSDSVPGVSPPGRVSGERMLQQQLGTRERADQFYQLQVLDHLNEKMRAFIGAQEWMFVATSDASGACDSTLRAGPAGFVSVLDDQRLAWPEYRGNGVMASRGNIIENPHVGLLFVDFVHHQIGLHVNARAHLVDDAELRADHPWLPVDCVPGRRPDQWLRPRSKRRTSTAPSTSRGCTGTPATATTSPITGSRRPTTSARRRPRWPAA